ncbi:MAG: hypothetical protein IT292_00680 [Deltaproteobacteria bacterium]|nr:hypothetical protein [Deltaproteobacteria bacterium]
MTKSSSNLPGNCRICGGIGGQYIRDSFCPVCSGTGQLVVGNSSQVCLACEGKKGQRIFIPCTVCNTFKRKCSICNGMGKYYDIVGQCERCEGVGYFLVGREKIDCPECHGQGGEQTIVKCPCCCSME